MFECNNSRKLLGMIALEDLLTARAKDLEAERLRERVMPLNLILPTRSRRRKRPVWFPRIVLYPARYPERPGKKCSGNSGRARLACLILDIGFLTHRYLPSLRHLVRTVAHGLLRHYYRRRGTARRIREPRQNPLFFVVREAIRRKAWLNFRVVA